MSEETKETTIEERDITSEALKPKPPSRRAPQGIRTFTVYRSADETGISGDGVIIEGVLYATGQVVLHWLLPANRGSIAIFDSFRDFLEIHVESHPSNGTIITFEDGEQHIYRQDGTKETVSPPED